MTIKEKIEESVDYICELGFDFVTTDILRQEFWKVAEFVRSCEESNE